MVVSMCAGSSLARDGIADYARHLSDALASKGVRVDPVTLGYYERCRPFYDDAAARASLGDICHVQYNYVYFNGEPPYRNTFLYFASRLSKPLVMTVHEIRMRPVSGGGAGPKAVLYAIASPVLNAWSAGYHRKMYGLAKAVIVHTRAHLDCVRRLIRDPDRAALIPHGVPPVSEPDRLFPKEEAKRSLGLAGRKVLSILGFINSKKGYEAALAALLRLAEDTVLLIAGGRMTDGRVDVEYEKRLRADISAMSLDARVKVTGYLDADGIRRAMAATDIVLAPYSPSAASGALALAIGYGKAIVASDIPVHAEICERAPCLRLFRSGDAKDLAEKIAAVSEDGSERRRLSEAALRYAAEYSYIKTASKTMEIYKALACG
jgi:glycosyltransferase involved in cell wall biosynthesis